MNQSLILKILAQEQLVMESMAELCEGLADSKDARVTSMYDHLEAAHKSIMELDAEVRASQPRREEGGPV